MVKRKTTSTITASNKFDVLKDDDDGGTATRRITTSIRHIPIKKFKDKTGTALPVRPEQTDGRATREDLKTLLKSLDADTRSKFTRAAQRGRDMNELLMDYAKTGKLPNSQPTTPIDSSDSEAKEADRSTAKPVERSTAPAASPNTVPLETQSNEKTASPEAITAQNTVSMETKTPPRGVIVVKGVNAFFTPEFVQGKIESQLNFKLRNVRTFQRDPEKAASPFHWWVITTETKEQLQEVTKQRTIAGCPVRWEPYMQRGVQQCYNCQGFQHIARNCTNARKCVKCHEQHGPNECRAPKFERGTGNKHLYYCVNCECHGHPANGRECPIRKAEEKRADQWEKNRPQQQRIPTSIDFNVGPKNQRGAPLPATEIPTSRTHWTKFTEREKLNENKDWKELCEMTKTEFGRTPGQMLIMCSEFIAKSKERANNGGTREDTQQALLGLYMELAIHPK